MPAKFPSTLARSSKRSRGRTSLEETPVAIRSTIPISRAAETRMRKKLARRIGHASPLIERGTIRFEDVNGPRGGIDTVCKIKLVLSGRPSVVASERGRDAEPAFERASSKVQHALQRVRGKQKLAVGRGHRAARSPKRRVSTRTAVAASRRAHAPRERAPMKIKTARRPPSRRAIKVKARRAKRRVGVQRARGH